MIEYACVDKLVMLTGAFECMNNTNNMNRYFYMSVVWQMYCSV